MKRLEKSKLFVVDYTIETQRPTFILATDMEEALKAHKTMFPSFHRNIKLIQFLSGTPFLTNKIAEAEIIDVVKQEAQSQEG
jgi:hypothetical protein